MRKINDGGPAFPAKWRNPGERTATATPEQLEELRMLCKPREGA